MRRIAIINQKGGVGKTTTAANLGSALARLGRRVVLVDLDAQANLSLHLGTDLASGEPSTYDLLHAQLCGARHHTRYSPPCACARPWGWRCVAVGVTADNDGGAAWWQA